MVTGNAWDWVPLRTFDYVRTELTHVPDDLYRVAMQAIHVEWHNNLDDETL